MVQLLTNFPYNFAYTQPTIECQIVTTSVYFLFLIVVYILVLDDNTQGSIFLYFSKLKFLDSKNLVNYKEIFLLNETI
jgi:hypothetical protein